MKHLDLEVQRELGTIVVESKVDWVEFSTSAIIFLPLLYQMIFESVKVEDLIEIGFLLSLFIILLFVPHSFCGSKPLDSAFFRNTQSEENCNCRTWNIDTACFLTSQTGSLSI